MRQSHERRHARAAVDLEGGRGRLRAGWGGQDHGGGHGRTPRRATPRRTRARVDRRSGAPAGDGPRARTHRQRRGAGRSGPYRRRRCRASGRALGRATRHEGVLGCPHPHARPRCRDPRPDPVQPALREHHGHVRPEPRLHRHGAPTRAACFRAIRLDRRRHATVAQCRRLPRCTRTHGGVLRFSAAALAHRALPVAAVHGGLATVLQRRRPDPRPAVPARDRRLLRVVPDDGRRVRRPCRGSPAHVA